MQKEFLENTEGRCPVVLVLDTSNAMACVDTTGQLSSGLQYMVDTIVQDAIAASRIELALITFGGKARVKRPFTQVFDFDVPYLKLGGEPRLGEAVLQALLLILERKALYRQNGIAYFRPWICILSGSDQKHHWRAAAAAAKSAEENREVTVFGIGVGDHVNMITLGQFSKKPPIKFKGMHLHEMHLNQIFARLWQSLTKISREKVDVAQQVDFTSTDGWGQLTNIEVLDSRNPMYGISNNTPSSAASAAINFPPLNNQRTQPSDAKSEYGNSLHQLELPPAPGWSTCFVSPAEDLGNNADYTVRQSQADNAALFINQSQNSIQGMKTNDGRPLVFVAYARKDAEIVHRFRIDLETLGVHLYCDTLDHRIGDTWRKKIDTALRKCEFCLAMFSPNACVSREFNREVDFVDALGKTILPVYVEPCSPSYHLIGLHAARLHDDYQAAIDQCIGALRSHPVYENCL